VPKYWFSCKRFNIGAIGADCLEYAKLDRSL